MKVEIPRSSFRLDKPLVEVAGIKLIKPSPEKEHPSSKPSILMENSLLEGI